MLIFGGCNASGTFFNDAHVLDTRTFTWHRPKQLNTAPAPRYHHSCCSINGRAFLYGGINAKQVGGEGGKQGGRCVAVPV